LLLPLRKGRPGEPAPASLIEVVYAERAEAWQAQGRARVALPSSDLPVSRTGLELYYPPRYRVTLEGGALRVASFAPPLAAVLNAPAPADGFARAAAQANAPATPGAKAEDARQELGDKPQLAGELQGLLERFEKDNRVKRAAGVLPLAVAFPAYGPSMFLAAELTAEGSAPALELGYRRSAK
jgi:hypothetical protein